MTGRYADRRRPPTVSWWMRRRDAHIDRICDHVDRVETLLIKVEKQRAELFALILDHRQYLKVRGYEQDFADWRASHCATGALPVIRPGKERRR